MPRDTFVAATTSGAARNCRPYYTRDEAPFKDTSVTTRYDERKLVRCDRKGGIYEYLRMAITYDVKFVHASCQLSLQLDVERSRDRAAGKTVIVPNLRRAKRKQWGFVWSENIAVVADEAHPVPSRAGR